MGSPAVKEKRKMQEVSLTQLASLKGKQQDNDDRNWGDRNAKLEKDVGGGDPGENVAGPFAIPKSN